MIVARRKFDNFNSLQGGLKRAFYNQLKLQASFSLHIRRTDGQARPNIIHIQPFICLEITTILMEPTKLFNLELLAHSPFATDLACQAYI